MATFKPFRKVVTTNKDLNLIQDNLLQTLDSLAKNPLLGGKLLSQVALKSGSNTLNHGLGRNYVSWAVFRPTAAMTLYETASPDPSKFLVLVASAPGAADLLVL